MVYAREIEMVNYMVYEDEGELWLRIRHLNSEVSASIPADWMCELLLHRGKIRLDGKKSDAKTLAFDLSGHLYSDDHKINTFLIDWVWIDVLLNLLLSTPKVGSCRIRSQTSINNSIIRISDRYRLDLKINYHFLTK